MDRSNNDRGFCSFRDASTVHSRANAATSAVSAASFCFFFEERRLRRAHRRGARELHGSAA